VEIIETFYKGLGGKFLLNPVKEKIQGAIVSFFYLFLKFIRQKIFYLDLVFLIYTLLNTMLNIFLASVF